MDTNSKNKLSDNLKEIKCKTNHQTRSRRKNNQRTPKHSCSLKIFFQNLFSEKLNSLNTTYKDSLNDFLINNQIKKLTNLQKESCEKPITENEILDSLKKLHNGNTPGTDRLSTDFYKLFWVYIKPLLIQSIEYAIETGELSIEQKGGIITLLPPKNKLRHLLKNWRPISLLNTDYKIIAKLIAKRIKTVLTLIINEDQTGYLKYRYIGENIRLLQDVNFYTEQRHINTILLSIDFEKAFDSLNWEFIFKVLKHVNLREKLLGLLK